MAKPDDPDGPGNTQGEPHETIGDAPQPHETIGNAPGDGPKQTTGGAPTAKSNTALLAGVGIAVVAVIAILIAIFR